MVAGGGALVGFGVAAWTVPFIEQRVSLPRAEFSDEYCSEWVPKANAVALEWQLELDPPTQAAPDSPVTFSPNADQLESRRVELSTIHAGRAWSDGVARYASLPAAVASSSSATAALGATASAPASLAKLDSSGHWLLPASTLGEWFQSNSSIRTRTPFLSVNSTDLPQVSGSSSFALEASEATVSAWQCTSIRERPNQLFGTAYEPQRLVEVISTLERYCPDQARVVQDELCARSASAAAGVEAHGEGSLPSPQTVMAYSGRCGASDWQHAIQTYVDQQQWRDERTLAIQYAAVMDPTWMPKQYASSIESELRYIFQGPASDDTLDVLVATANVVIELDQTVRQQSMSQDVDSLFAKYHSEWSRRGLAVAARLTEGEEARESLATLRQPAQSSSPWLDGVLVAVDTKTWKNEAAVPYEDQSKSCDVLKADAEELDLPSAVTSGPLARCYAAQRAAERASEAEARRESAYSAPSRTSDCAEQVSEAAIRQCLAQGLPPSSAMFWRCEQSLKEQYMSLYHCR